MSVPLSPRQLNGVATNLAQKFSVSCEHFVWLAQRGQAMRIEIDLLKLSIDPPGYDSERNLNLIKMCRELLDREAGRLRELQLTEASLALELGVAPPGDDAVPVSVYARLKDATGREWAGRFEHRCVPAA